ncbi:MAG TPA: DUF2167 domain-containing protein [Kofleriaceae bacterium]|nr:DUF2167 domain-containing protein [Kofleriaceae bacterium]
MRMRSFALASAMVVGVVATAAAEEQGELLPHKVGPQIISLGLGVQIDLPAGMILFERTEARQILEERGDHAEKALAIVTKLDAEWELAIDMLDIGYVSDKDADKLDAGDLLASMKAGTQEQNKVRAKKGVAPLEVLGWNKEPSYDRQRRVLSWSTNLMTEGQPFLNEDTNILGRRGYASAVLIASVDGIEQARVEAAPAITGITFEAGHRHEEFDPAVDKDSGIGLRELVTGGGVVAVASKLGFFGKIALAFKKFFVVIGAALAGLAKWLFGRRKKDAAAAE